MLVSEKPIVLVGPMGVGKSTIGKKLARELGVEFVDSDLVISELHGDISEIFENEGETRFREYEEEVVLGHLGSRKVLATGGGAVLSSRIREALKMAYVVYLATDGRHMSSRLANGKRPLLKNGISDWRKIYDSRKHLYEAVADFTLDTSNSGLKQNVKAILEKVDSHD